MHAQDSNLLSRARDVDLETPVAALIEAAGALRKAKVEHDQALANLEALEAELRDEVEGEQQRLQRVNDWLEGVSARTSRIIDQPNFLDR